MSDIKQKTKIGMLWNASDKILVQVTSFVLSIILARLLSPSDYGTLGLLSIFISFSNVFIDSGFSRALIQKQDRKEVDFSTVFIFNATISLCIYLVLFFAAPLIADFYNMPALVDLQRVFFLVIFIDSLGVVQSAKLQIRVDFRSIAIINLVSVIVSGVTTIICAYNGLGVWALVIYSLVKSCSAVILYWNFARWTPVTGFSMGSFKSLFKFGSKLLASGLLSTSLNNITSLVIGKFYTPANLGFYSKAQHFPELTAGTITSVLNTSTFPLMASLQDRPEEMMAIFRKLIKITAMFVFPAMIGLACLSETIILVLLGEKWQPTAYLLFWLTLSYIFNPLSVLNMNLLNAIGRSDLFLKIDFIKIPFILITMVITFPISLNAIVIGKAVTAFIYFYINSFLIGKMYGFGGFKQLTCSWKYIISAILMGFVVVSLDNMIGSGILSLIFGVLGGAIIYMILLFILQDIEFMNLLIKFKDKVLCKK